jgi:hypothetical protein
MLNHFIKYEALILFEIDLGPGDDGVFREECFDSGIDAIHSSFI